MKLSEVRPCDNCGEKITPLFYISRISMAIFTPATNQVLGLNQMFGGALGLAEVFAPEPDVVKIAGDEDPQLMTEIFLCQPCYMRDVNLALLIEKINNKKEDEDDV